MASYIHLEDKDVFFIFLFAFIKHTNMSHNFALTCMYIYVYVYMCALILKMSEGNSISSDTTNRNVVVVCSSHQSTC